MRSVDVGSAGRRVPLPVVLLGAAAGAVSLVLGVAVISGVHAVGGAPAGLLLAFAGVVAVTWAVGS